MQLSSLRPKKRLGQNFLINDKVKDRIISSCAFSKGEDALEIGAGAGALTHAIAKSCRKLYAVEIDKTLCGLLEDNLEHCENVELICGDILKVGLGVILKKARANKIKIVGNLPYYITTPILEWLIDNKRYISGIFIMVQKEYADRIFAKPSSKAYGALTLYVNRNFRPELLFQISKGCFYPKPKVDSVFMKLYILDTPHIPVKDEALLFKIIRSSFNQRRKTLLNSISAGGILGGDKAVLRDVFKHADISPERRGETLSMEEFVKLSDFIWRQVHGDR